MNTQRAAESLIKRKISVLPVQLTWNGTKFDKKPALSSWKHLQTQLPSREELEQWFMSADKDDTLGLGIITGKISNLIVLDFEKDFDFTEAKKRSWVLPTTLTVKTPSGGHHYYYRPASGKPMLGNSVRIQGLPFDIRSEGGFVACPPTKGYKWANTEQIAPLPVWVYEAATLTASTDWKEKISKDVPQGARNETLASIAGKLFRNNEPELWEESVWPALLAWNKRHNTPSLVEEEVRSIYESISKKEYQERSNRTNSTTNAPESGEVEWPRPPAPNAFYGLAGRIVGTLAPNSEADRVALLANFLVAFGNVIGDNAHFKVEADTHPMRLFATLVGETAKGRKGTSWGHMKKIFQGIDEVWAARIQTGLSSGEGLIWAVRDEILAGRKSEEGTYKTIDEGVTDKRLLVFEDEFSSTLRVMSREGNTLSAIIRRAWDTGNLQTLTKNSPAKATGAHVSIIAHITKDELLRYLNDVERANGFGNRFLWFCTKRSQSLPFGKSSTADLYKIIQDVNSAVEFSYEAGEITWGAEAAKVWEEVYPELSEGKQGIFGSMTARAEAYVTRLACIYALLDQSTKIETPHLEAALALWDYCERSINYIFQDNTGDSVADDIVKALQQAEEGLTKTQISNYFGRNVHAGRLYQAINILQEQKIIRVDTTSPNGRTKEVYVLNSLNSLNSYPNLNQPNPQNDITNGGVNPDKNTSLGTNTSPTSYENNEINEFKEVSDKSPNSGEKRGSDGI